VSKKKANKNLVNEPTVLYETFGNTSLTISSVEEQEEDNYANWRSLTPRQRLALHLKMAKEVYKEELKNSKPYDQIYFND
jgi:hypothetical protein